MHLSVSDIVLAQLNKEKEAACHHMPDCNEVTKIYTIFSFYTIISILLQDALKTFGI